jgi:RNA polymerase sigma-70 factor (ECF subfamily)
LNHDSSDPLITNEQLACQAQAGCAASFEELVVRFQVPLLHFLRHRGAAGEAEDLVQETMVRAYENLHRYRQKWKFSTWLYTIARRLNVNHHRRQNKFNQPRANGLTDDNKAGLEAIPSDGPQPQQLAIEAEQRQRLWAVAAEVLSEEQNTAMWLHYVEGLPIVDIARVLDRSRVSVKAMMFRARKKLLPLVRQWEPGRRMTGNTLMEETMAAPDAQPLLSPTKGVSYV